MRALLINAVCGIKSTGRICTDLASDLEHQGYEVKIAYGRDSVPKQYNKYAIRIGNSVEVYWHALMAKLFDDRGFWSKFATKRFLKWADEFNPDLLWLHNLHDYYINIEILFEWIKNRPNMEVRWTQHDCWSFTGRCVHFSVSQCNQWKTYCKHCEYSSTFPKSPLINRCYQNYGKKKRSFSGVNNMTIITPSHWLAELSKQSFLKEYPVEVINNKIDRNIFKPTPSNYRERLGLENKKIILGVASVWDWSKGLDDFVKLSKIIDKDFVIILVGLSDKQIKRLPSKIVGIKKTNSAFELAQIYSVADVFVNLTYEDTYPTVNLEAKACGTPIVTYNTGGSPESAGSDALVVEQGDLIAVKNAVLKLC